MRSRLLIVLAAVATLAAAAPAARADSDVSSNWAGYAVHGTRFRRVIGTWRQPAVSCRPGHPTYSAYWVGLGGYSLGAQALEQIGTEADCTARGTESLSAWYEMVPQASVTVPLAVDPGDLMSATVSVSGHETTLSLTDRTRGQRFRTAVSTSDLDVSSAEWIVEAPSACTGFCTLPLADFGLTAFTQARAETVRGRWGTIGSPRWRSTAITLAPGGGRTAAVHSGEPAGGAAVPSGLSAGGGAFTVTYAAMQVTAGPARDVVTEPGRGVVHPVAG